MMFLLCAVVLAEAPTEEEAEQAEETEEAYQEVSNDVNILKVYIQDHKLSYKGYAPPGWEQPGMEVYEADLDGRPSLLPYEDFMRAVADGLVDPVLGMEYALWVTDQMYSDRIEKAVAKE